MSAPRQDVCHRCLEPLPPNATRCTSCGERRQGTIGRVPLLIGTAGVLALVFLVWIMVVVIKNEEFMNSPSVDENGFTQQQQEQPAKPPALDK